MRKRHLLSVPLAAVLIGVSAVPLATAQDTSGLVVHRQSVLTEVDDMGTFGTSRVFTQLSVPSGQTVQLPGQSTSGLRRLSGSDLNIDGSLVGFGSGLSRTVANNTADLPISIEVRYAVDGRFVAPRQVAGHDGDVAVTYVVKNLTATPTELTLVDGDGKKVTQTVDIAVPMVGSLSLTLPAGYRDVVAPGAVVVGDGRGGTVVSWSLLLFSPLGSETQEVTWTATTTDAVVPAASLQIVPVTPKSFGSLGSTEAAYSGAVEATTELTDGAREIDANLQKLADGAAELLAGMTRLRDGAQELATGLVTAQTGAKDLSAGITKARAGSDELGTGLGTLAAGSKTIADALAKADAGGRDLSTGLGRLSAGSGELAQGLSDLSDGAALVDANTGLLAAGAGELSAGAAELLAGIELLKSELLGPTGLPTALAGIDGMQAGIGTAATEDTILYGLSEVATGLETLQATIGTPAAAGTLRSGVAGITAGVTGIGSANTEIDALATQVLSGLQTVIASLDGIDESLLGGTDQVALATAVATLVALSDAVDGIAAYSAGIAAGVSGLQLGLTQIDGGLALMSQGIGDPLIADTLRNGVFRITAGVSNPACSLLNPTDPANPCGLLQVLGLLEVGLTAAATDVAAGLGDADTENTLIWGADQVAGGTEALADGAAKLQAEGTSAVAAGAKSAADGAGELATGAASAATGGATLSDGLGQLADGGEELSAGAARAAAGGTSLANGLAQLDAGGAKLATGLGDAVEGAEQIADGQVQATDGGQQVADGSQRLVDEGTSVLAGSVSEATVSSSLQLEQVRAVAERGLAGDGLPYPTVEGADASAVFQFDLAGVGAAAGGGFAGHLVIGLVALLAAAALAVVGRSRLRAQVIDLTQEKPLLTV